MSADKSPTMADKLPGYEVPSALHSLLECVAADIRKVPLISKHGVRVLPEYHGDLFNAINALLGKKLSVLVHVGFEAAAKGDESLIPVMRDTRLVVHVYESLIMNQSASGTRVSALVFAERILARWHSYTPSATTALPSPAPITPAKENTLRLNRDESAPASGMICYTLRANTSVCLCTDDE